MYAGRTLFVGASVADMRSDRNQRWPSGFFASFIQRLLQCLQIVAVINPLDMPAVSHKSTGAVFGKCDIRITFDGNVIIIVKIDQLSQAQVPRQRSRLMGDTFHEIPITDNAVGKMVHYVMTGSIKAFSQVAFGQSHAYAIGKALSQRAGGGLHPRCEPVFGMAGCLAAPLAEILKLRH